MPFVSNIYGWQGWNPGQNRTGKTRVIPKTVNPSNSNQNPGWNRNQIQCFSRKKYAKKSILSVLNCKIMEFFKIIISIGILNSKIVPFKAKFEGHKLYWHDSYYQIHSLALTHPRIYQKTGSFIGNQQEPENPSNSN